jgi:hypothetical protein
MKHFQALGKAFSPPEITSYLQLSIQEMKIDGISNSRIYVCYYLCSFLVCSFVPGGNKPYESSNVKLLTLHRNRVVSSATELKTTIYLSVEFNNLRIVVILALIVCLRRNNSQP